MGFQFSLSAVLRVRSIVEEREERMLQRILFEIAQTLEAIGQKDEEMEETDKLRAAEVFKQSIGRNLHASDGHVKHIRQSKKDLEEQIEKLKALRDRQLVIYEAARKNREMLTDMRNERRSEYDADMARAEQKALDDNYIARRGRF
jgi:hypothetical protein